MNISYNLNCTFNDKLDSKLFPFFYSILMIISIPANLLSLYISYCQIQKKNELGIYLFCLSLADLLYTMTLPLWIYYAQNGDDWTFSLQLCRLSAFLQYLNYYTSSGFLTCISLDRYLAIVHPFRFQSLRSRKYALLMSFLVWAFEIMSNIQILYRTDFYYEVANKTRHISCYDTYPLQQWQAYFNYYRICVGYSFPLAVMIFCYLKIYQAVKHNQATQDCDKKKINHLLLGIIITFFLCFTPYHIILLLRSILEPQNCYFTSYLFVPYRITTALTSINCIADPILYCFVNETGRADIWNILKCGFFINRTAQQSSVSQNRTCRIHITQDQVACGLPSVAELHLEI
ncbi:psychosine receptor [Notechis scutatus]|uniref:Psychosine receptor n=1 Tax=Notechis scutatus TaxID=8663 RepID=A0A6J1UVD2_9SAUR|nr:psychosine receptor [Notechis scutatus]